MHEFEAIEDGVLSALQPLKSSGTVRTLEPYAGQLGEPDLRVMATRFPCLYVIAQGLEVSWSGAMSEQHVTVSLLVAAKNLRGPQAAARGDSTPGAYDVLEAARAALHRKTVVSGWSVMRTVREAPVVYAPETGICVYEATYEIRRKTI